MHWTNGAYGESWTLVGMTSSEMPTPVALPTSHHFHPSLSPGRVVHRSNPTHQLTDPTHYKWENLDPIRPTQYNSQWSLQSSNDVFLYKENLCCPFSQSRIDLFMFLLIIIHSKNKCLYVTQKQTLQRNVQNVLSSSSASQHEGPIPSHKLSCWTQPNPPKTLKSRPSLTQPNPWVNPTHGQLCRIVAHHTVTGPSYFDDSSTESVVFIRGAITRIVVTAFGLCK